MLVRNPFVLAVLTFFGVSAASAQVIFVPESEAEKLVPEERWFSDLRDGVEYFENSVFVNVETAKIEDYEQLRIATGLDKEGWRLSAGLKREQLDENPFAARRKFDELWERVSSSAYRRFGRKDYTQVVLFYDWSPVDVTFNMTTVDGKEATPGVSIRLDKGVKFGPELGGGGFQIKGRAGFEIPDLDLAERLYNLTDGFSGKFEATALCHRNVEYLYKGQFYCHRTSPIALRYNGKTIMTTSWKKVPKTLSSGLREWVEQANWHIDWGGRFYLPPQTPLRSSGLCNAGDDPVLNFAFDPSNAILAEAYSFWEPLSTFKSIDLCKTESNHLSHLLL